MSIKRILTFSLIFTIYSTIICYAGVNDVLNKIDLIGNNFLHVVYRIGKWVIIITCMMEILKCAFNHNRNGVGQVIVTGGFIYGAIYFIPYMMGIIEEVFQ